jgi:hypothetical protein
MTRMLLIAWCAALALPVAAAAPEWLDYQSPDGRFKVKLPAAPKEVHEVWDVYLSSAGATHFGIRVTPIHPDQLGSTAAELYDSLQRAESHVISGTVLGSRAVTNEGHPGREFVLQGQCPNGPCLLTYRVFRKADRLFVLTVYASPEDPATADASTFLESFRITK